MTIRYAGRLVDVVVVVPARDEADRIGACLRSVRASLQQAVRAGAVGQVAVAVVGHRCVDDTLGRAAPVLAGLPHVLIGDTTATTVGEVRALGVRAALDLLPGGRSDPGRPLRSPRGGGAREVWILNTDADSVVPATWVIDVLAHARGGHQAIVGLARLDRLHRPANPARPAPARPAVALAYRRIITAGFRGRFHDHVYGANLAVRADAYAAVGGFPYVRVGEDRALLDALAEHGRPLVRPRDVVVTTSARRDGRAVGGLATLLDTLDRTHPPMTDDD